MKLFIKWEIKQNFPGLLLKSQVIRFEDFVVKFLINKICQ